MTLGELDALGDEALIEACIGPTVRRVMGKSLTDKIRLTGGLTNGLTNGQRALLMFRMLQGHSGEGALALFWQLSHLFVYKGVWLEFKKGLNYFEDKVLAQLGDRLENAYNEVEMAGAGLADLPEWEARSGAGAALEPLDRDMREQMPAFVRAVAACIRRRPDDFINTVK